MNNRSKSLASGTAIAMALLMFLAFFTACGNDDTTPTSTDDGTILIIDDTDFQATDWTTVTHSKDADPDFDEVFEDNTVKRIDFVITAERWQIMLKN